MVQHTVVHFEIPADDPEELVDFYEELFGWKIKAAEGFDDYWLIDTVEEEGEGVDGGLMPRQHPGHAPLNYIWVESVADYAAKAEELGGKIVMEKTPVGEMGWVAMIEDSQGNQIGLWETAQAG